MKETRLRGSAEDGKGVGDGSKVRLTGCRQAAPFCTIAAAQKGGETP